jgi:glycosyltransferase involved in cell wall biosynthesis
MQLKRRYRWYEKLLAKWYDRLWASGCHKIIVSNQFNANILIKEGVNPRKIHVVYNYPDTPEITMTKVEVLAKHNIPSDRIIIGTVARLSAAKDWTTFFKTIRRTVQRRKDVHFLIVGDGALYEQLDKTVMEMEMADHVTFAGFQSNVWNYYGVMDIFLLCSFGEGVPNVVLEAMAMGLPIVSTDSGAVREAVSAHIVGRENHIALTAEIIRLCKIMPVKVYYGMTKFTQANMLKALQGVL